MSRIEKASRRYANIEALVKDGLNLFVVADPEGAQLDAVIRRILRELGEERSDAWNAILQPAKLLRWRRLTQLQPRAFQTHQEIIDEVTAQAQRLRNLVGSQHLLAALAEAAVLVGESDSEVGTILQVSITEVDPQNCVVVANNGAARANLQAWLSEQGALAFTPAEVLHLEPNVETAYVVGPPRFYPPALVTSPVTPEVTFVMPSWFADRSLPEPPFSQFAQGRLTFRTTEVRVGDVAPLSTMDMQDVEPTASYIPQPEWGSAPPAPRQPGSDEVLAWKVLLTGGLAIWLDDGERIRSLEPYRAQGERVTGTDIRNVERGTFLVLREGESERGALFNLALAALGEKTETTKTTQSQWKALLREKLAGLGTDRVVASLSSAGVQSARQAPHWVEPTLISPRRKRDFELLLRWLDVTDPATFENASSLRRAVHKASTDIRKELESAVSTADMALLEREGILHLESPREGLRGMFVTRVLGKSPFTKIVKRREVRVPFPDRSARWLD